MCTYAVALRTRRNKIQNLKNVHVFGMLQSEYVILYVSHIHHELDALF